VTLDEALAELGLELGASSDEARRAYLRLLKTRKPEVDPQGFMRLREAYELARSQLPRYEALRKGNENAPRLPIATPGGLVWIGTSQPPAAEPPPNNPAAPAETQETTTVEASADPPVLLDEPRPEEPAPTPADDARAGTHLPWQSPPPAPAPAPAPDEAPEPQPSVEKLYANGKVKTAARLATRLYREAAARGDDSPALPHTSTTLRVLLALHQRNKLAEGLELQKSFAAWLDVTGLEPRVLTVQLAVLWAVARELGACPASLPLEVRAAIAAAALEGDLGRARSDCASFRHALPLLALAAAGELRTYAPSLAALVAEVLDPSALRPTRASPKPSMWIIVPILIGVLRLVGAVMPSSPSTSDPPAYTYRPPLALPSPTLERDAGRAPRSIWDLVDASYAEPSPAPDASAGTAKKADAEGTAQRNTSHAKDKPPKPAASAPDAGPCGGTNEP
jgi:hypothetical protein